MTDYLTQALRACRLPIRVRYEQYGLWAFSIREPRSIVRWCDTMLAKRCYVISRDRLLAEEEKETDHAIEAVAGAYGGCMTADYLTEALRACRLPISVFTFGNAIVVGKGKTGCLCDTPEQATNYYLSLRDRLLRQEEDKDAE